MATSNGFVVGVLVGVYFGVNMLQVPNPIKVASLCSEYNIMKIRLHEPNTTILDAFINMNVGFTFDIPNVLLRNMNNNSTVESWFNTFVKPYSNSINLEYIVVGEEGHTNILPIMKVLQRLLDANFLSSVKLTTIISYTSLISNDLPSSGAFHPNIKENLKDVLNFLAEQGWFDLMANLYPFKKYVYDNGGNISIDYATFGLTESVRDGSFVYHNLFDAMVDTIYVAIDKLGDEKLNNIEVVIGETGWPTNGREVDSTVALASKYNQKFISHVFSQKGTPRRPNTYLNGYIRSLFNEDLSPQGESQYYGLFNTNFTPIYPIFQPN